MINTNYLKLVKKVLSSKPLNPILFIMTKCSGPDRFQCFLNKISKCLWDFSIIYPHKKVSLQWELVFTFWCPGQGRRNVRCRGPVVSVGFSRDCLWGLHLKEYPPHTYTLFLIKLQSSAPFKLLESPCIFSGSPSSSACNKLKIKCPW